MKAAALWSGRPGLALEEHNADATAPGWLRVLVIVFGIGIGSLFLASQANAGSDPFETMWNATFGTASGFSQVLLLGTPLILAGCAVAVARRVGLWNIGVDGQLYFGAWLGTAIAFTVPGAPGTLLTIGILVGGLIGGAIWALTPVLLRVYLNVNEVVTTLLLNFVASSWVLYWVTTPWAAKGLQGAGSLASKELPAGATLPNFTVGSVQVNIGFPIAIAVVLLVVAVLRFTRAGFKASLTGADVEAARYAGFSVHRIQIFTFLAAGAIGGLAGTVLELDKVHTLSTDLSTNTGYYGIVVAILAGRAMFTTIPMGILMGALAAIGTAMQLIGVSSSANLVLTGLLLLLGAAADAMARYRIRVTPAETDVTPIHEVMQKDPV